LLLFEAYKALFTDSYRRLQTNIDKAVEELTRLDVEANIEAFTAALKEKGLDIRVSDADASRISGFKLALEDLVKKKQRDLAEPIDVSTASEVVALVQVLKPIEEMLEQKRAELTEPDIKEKIAATTRQFKDAQLRELRNLAKWRLSCEQYLDAGNRIEVLKKDRAKLNKELLKEQIVLFDVHQATINEYLGKLDASFRIDRFKPEKDDRRGMLAHYCAFDLVFNDLHAIDPSASSEASHTFDNSLSESDKRLLAFAFFMATLMHDRDLSEKIVVFDDPMSSFDKERKRATAKLINELCEEASSPEQVIVLGHEESFLRELLGQTAMTAAAQLKLVAASDDPASSKLEHMRAETDMPRDMLLIELDELESMHTARRVASGFQNKCRTVLDEVLSRKYRRHLRELPIRAGTRSYVEHLSINKIGGFEAECDEDGRLLESSANRKTKDFLAIASELNQDSHQIETEHSEGDDLSLLQEFFHRLEEL
jgi:wobble nucleotide-excising tRNase